AQTYDVLIRNAHILDGAGNPWFSSDVAIQGDRIVAVGRLDPLSAATVVDAAGLTLAPGFIDTHSHGIRGIQETPSAENQIRQGVTTIIEGPDGSSPIPLRPFLDKLGESRIGVNFGILAGHGSIRQKVMGSENRRATSDELERMKELTRQAMLDGAFGLSTGLFYVPGNYAPTEEVIELAKVAGSMGGLHTSHMRDEAAGVVDSVKETIRIGEEGHLPTQVTHHKVIGKANWGRSVETLRLVETARARGVDATIDAYPYTASSTGTGALFPQWAMAGGSKALAERLAAPESRAKIKAEIVNRIVNDRGAGDPKNVVMASCGFDRALAGKSLADITRERGKEASFENAAETAIEIQLKGGCSAIYHAISEEDVERILRYPYTMIASDGGIPAFGRDVPHPRNYGTFARVLGRYVRERKVLTLEEAVRKMTGLPAQRFGLQDRGLIRPGMKADLVLFDPATIADKSDFATPHQYAVGVHSVWVNGIRTLAGGAMTGQRGGKPLLGPACKP
ncbi:MAG: D-aminoacylase, partial [Acidobacteria bacterium]|nr:D-aminoacylase [Acidobacteriota bacterium]